MSSDAQDMHASLCCVQVCMPVYSCVLYTQRYREGGSATLNACITQAAL